MKSAKAASALKGFLLRLPEEVRKHLTPVTPSSLGQPHLLHISRRNDLESFVPRLSDFLAKTEDRSVPRICTAPTLFGCFLGYQREIIDFTKREPSGGVAFLGGWEIYGLPFDIALLPGKELLPDVNETGEHWLVTYDQFTVDYEPVHAGKVFFTSVESVAANKTTRTIVNMVIENTTETPLHFDGQISLGKGYWQLEMEYFKKDRSWRDCKGVISCDEITEDIYRGLKKTSASLLNHASRPVSMNW